MAGNGWEKDGGEKMAKKKDVGEKGWREKRMTGKLFGGIPNLEGKWNGP